VKMKDVAWAARNLATTQSAGLPVVRALRMLGRQRRGEPIGDTLLRVHESVVNGAALTDAFRSEERALTPLTTALVEAGEANGKLDASLTSATGSGKKPRLGIALAVISAAQLMVVLDATIVNIALPTLQRDLGFSAANVSWVVNAYTLAFGGLLLLGGRIADYNGRKRTFIIGLLGFAGASALGGLAQNEAMLFAARALQGAFHTRQ